VRLGGRDVAGLLLAGDMYGIPALGYADAAGRPIFQGAVSGSLAAEPRGSKCFGYDAIFVPGNGHRTFAEMTSQEKNQVSHRRLAVQAMRDGLGLT
jgi:XTP/dITP diphosphohydrolase